MTPTRATWASSPPKSAMFDDVAPRYDLVNDVLSLGQDRSWRKVVARTVGATEGEPVLDVAAGTGTSSASFTTAGAQCVATDFSQGMLRQGARQRGGAAGRECASWRRRPALPFADESFDVVTISFGLRNVHDVDAALRELRRVTKSGGCLVICEFSSPTWTPFRRAYDAYLGVMPSVVKKVSSNPDSYVYLAESIRAWPVQAELAQRIQAAGWTSVAWRNLTGGIVAVHRAKRSAG